MALVVPVAYGAEAPRTARLASSPFVGDTTCHAARADIPDLRKIAQIVPLSTILQASFGQHGLLEDPTRKWDRQLVRRGYLPVIDIGGGLAERASYEALEALKDYDDEAVYERLETPRLVLPMPERGTRVLDADVRIGLRWNLGEIVHPEARRQLLREQQRWMDMRDWLQTRVSASWQQWLAAYAAWFDDKFSQSNCEDSLSEAENSRTESGRQTETMIVESGRGASTRGGSSHNGYIALLAAHGELESMTRGYFSTLLKQQAPVLVRELGL